MSFLQIAKKLNYLNEYIDNNKLIRLWNINGYSCNCNKKNCDECNLKNNDINENKLLWKELLNRKKCLYCKKKHDISYYKPFCLSCYKIIVNDEYDEIIEENDEIIEKYDNDGKIICSGYGECLTICIGGYTMKKSNYTCDSDCVLCGNYPKCKSAMPKDIADNTGGLCINCDADNFFKKKGRFKCAKM